ncbi:biotin transporter BioY [Corynebacterium kutscheri]|uniref:biotin transporter BioY n=1 Tax=Corynebacterium kutscheri TaxID=35755 RepID=UPI0037BF2E9E
MSTIVINSRNRLTDLAYIAVFSALIIVLAFVSIPVGAAGVPIVLQNAAIVLAGLVLGGRRGFLAAALFLGLGLLGLPVLAGGRSVLAALPGVSIGYLVGYLISPLVAGIIAYTARGRSKAQTTITFIIAAAVGLIIQYLCGSIGLVIRADMSFGAALAAQGAFVIPDAVKFSVVVIIALSVHAAFPDLMRKK